jgi:hypothetical protein
LSHAVVALPFGHLNDALSGARTRLLEPLQ